MEASMIPTIRKTGLGLMVAACLLCTGCIKIRLTVQLNEDGSGQVVEDIVFGEKLVDAAKRLKNGPTVEELTSDEHIKKRLPNMGKGVSLVSKKVDKQVDGSVRMVAVYAFEDISELRLAPMPFGAGWEDTHLAFTLRADTSLAAQYSLDIRFQTPQGKDRPKQSKSELPPLSEREAQQVRQLLPIFKDLLEGFELKLRLEVYDAKKWATTTRGHPTSTHLNPLSGPGGRLTIFHLTDRHLNSSDDGLMLVVPWRQVGRELDLEKGPNWNGLQLLPHVHFFREYGGAMNFTWRAVQMPHGKEYY